MCERGDRMNEFAALLLTLLVGLFIVLGTAIIFITKNNKKIVQFSISTAFGVMASLIILELLPESFEHLSEGLETWQAVGCLLFFIIIGVLLLKALDLFVPDHHEKEHEKVDEENLTHIGIVASVALILHNIIEGMAIYTSVLSSLELGILMCIGVGLHNIPMGMVIASTFYTSKKHLKRTIGIVFLTAISTLFGGLLMFFMSGMLNEFLLGILLAITTGMVLYIAVFELFPHLVEHKKEKGTITGVLLGVALLLVSVLLGGHHH